MTTWNGKVCGFGGLLNFDAALQRTSMDKSVSFKLFDKEDKSSIKRTTTRESDGKVVTREQIVKGLSHQSGDTVLFTEEEIAELKGTLDQAIDVLDYIPRDQVPSQRLISSYYYVLPRGNTKNLYSSYLLFCDALKSADCAAVVRFVMRSKQYTGIVFCDGEPGREYLMLGLIPYEDEVVDIPASLEAYWEWIANNPTTEKNLTTAVKIMDEYRIAEFDHGKYTDEYKTNILAEAEKKLKTRGKKKLDNVIPINRKKTG